MSTRCRIHIRVNAFASKWLEFLVLRGFRFRFTPCTKGSSSERLSVSLLGSHPHDVGTVPLQSGSVYNEGG
jgi:metal-dependent HD superfamily phosphatase/phosphodiesterase